MAQTVIVHLMEANLIVGEIDQLPNPTDQFMILQDPRQRDGSKLGFLRPEVTTILIPWHRISYVQLVPESGQEKIFGFVRD